MGEPHPIPSVGNPDLAEPTEALVEAMSALEGDILILGVAGKMGPSLAELARRASDAAGVRRRIIGVARFTRPDVRRDLEAAGIETIVCDLFDWRGLEALPEARNVVYMVGQKFGADLNPRATWAINVGVAAQTLSRFPTARWVVFSTGNVYPLTPVAGPGPAETDPVGPVGAYAQSALAREFVVSFFSQRNHTPAVLLRLNYACELQYGVLRDIADKVQRGEAIDLTMGHVNVIWQRDANAVALRALAHATAPPFILNVTGEKVAVREIATDFAHALGVTPLFTGTESATALLSDPAKCRRLFGPPPVTLDQMIAWIGDWITRDGRSLESPTHYTERDGRF